MVKTASITSCVTLHRIATKTGAMTLLNHCMQLISLYWNDLPLQNVYKMEVDLEVDPDNCMSLMTVSLFTINILYLDRVPRRTFFV